MPTNIGDNRLDTTNIARINQRDALRLSRYLVKPGDIVYSRRGDVEKRALIRGAEAGWLCGTGCLRVRVGDGDIEPVYLSYYLAHPAVRNWIVQHAIGATMPNLNTGILSSLPVVVPPLHIQRRIAHILGTLDDKIELNRRMNQTLEAIARAIFKSWFIDFDPVHAKAESREPVGMAPETAALFPGSFQDSPLGKIPKGWEVGPILEQADLLSGGTPKTSRKDYWGGDIQWASAKDVSQCRESFLLQTERTITELGLEESAAQLIPALSTVVVARGATTGRMAVFGSAMAMNQTCYALVSKRQTPFSLYCQLRFGIDEMVHAAHGSVFDTITTTTFRNVLFVLPPLSVRTAFEKPASQLFRQILAASRESCMLLARRDSLLPKLLSGEINAVSEKVPLQ